MFKKYVSIVYLIFLLNSFLPATGQNIYQNGADSIILKALNDEMYRNLNELSDKEAGKPFFISYIYLDGEVTEASAILGALRYSNKFKTSSYYLRLLMGNYTINDENFQDNYSREQDENYSIVKELPIEPDYYGIRNAFWWNTSRVFRSATRNYLSKLAALKDKPLGEDEELLPDYTAADPVQIHQPCSIVPLKKTELEKLVREVSNVFRDYKEVYISNASAYNFSATIYIVNTEGSEIRIPLNIMTMDVSANVYSSKGEIFKDNIAFVSPSFHELPPVDTLKSAAKKLANYLMNLKKSEIVSETYTGPVLFEGNEVAKIFAGCLFGRAKPLIADRDPLVNSLSKSMLPKNNYSRESKLDKRIISKDLTVKSMPHLKEYNNKPLLGSYNVDAECIVPPDELTLVDKGVLKTMLCDRIPTKNIKQSNGHNRIGLAYGGFTTGMAPGVIMVESENKTNIDGLKKQMIAIAKEKGLDYVLVVKPLINGNCSSPLCFYKHDINTNKEELIYNMSLPKFELKNLNDILGTGDSSIVSNEIFNGMNPGSTTLKTGYPASFIVPNALLIRELELNPEFPYSDLDLPFYDSPVEPED